MSSNEAVRQMVQTGGKQEVGWCPGVKTGGGAACAELPPPPLPGWVLPPAAALSPALPRCRAGRRPQHRLPALARGRGGNVDQALALLLGGAAGPQRQRAARQLHAPQRLVLVVAAMLGAGAVPAQRVGQRHETQLTAGRVRDTHATLHAGHACPAACSAPSRASQQQGQDGGDGAAHELGDHVDPGGVPVAAVARGGGGWASTCGRGWLALACWWTRGTSICLLLTLTGAHTQDGCTRAATPTTNKLSPVVDQGGAKHARRVERRARERAADEGGGKQRVALLVRCRGGAAAASVVAGTQAAAQACTALDDSRRLSSRGSSSGGGSSNSGRNGCAAHAPPPAGRCCRGLAWRWPPRRPRRPGQRS